MCERRGQGDLGTEVPSGVQGQSPGRRSGDTDVFFVNEFLNYEFWREKWVKRPKIPSKIKVV